ncbi:hypothetical protein [Celeribacter naphthalenivorans]|uniref:hypothetical protein n=1 Tax=Celeribacter naphthalenivorans TaxID=1614694 RepID=UPI001CFAF78C|nr:hypothetical protein [Celeribacter naphthalenivorans]
MVSDSKILTVSYGTFSCTLEGFDDPFNTMRSIAEYFRDLAADDRYFGAEPPTPDPQMLSSIAEKEIQRRVEARVQEGGLVLRQMGETQDAVNAAPAPLAPRAAPKAPVSAEVAQKTVEKTAEPPVEEAPKEDVKAVAAQPVTRPAATPSAAPALAAGSSIADKLERIRAAVAQRNQADFVEDQNDAMNFSAPLAQEPEEDSVEEAEELIESIVEDDIIAEAPVEVTLDEISVETIEDEVLEITEAPVIEETVEEIEAEELSSIAAPFQEAAAILAEMNAEIAAEDQGETAEVEPLEVEAAEAETIALEEIEDDADEAVADEDETLGNVLSSLTEETAEEEAPVLDADTELHEMDPNLAADIAEATRPEEDAAEEEEAANDPLRRVRARVVKMRRADFEAQADADSEDTAETDDDFAAKLRRELGSSTLDAEDEDDLMRELAEVAAIGAETDETEEAEVEEDTALFSDSDDEDDGADAANVFDASDASMSRLMDETDREMAKGENTRRRNAIQHLKAAVGAIRAEKAGKGETIEEDEAQDYKEDLARVVRPSRPEGTHQIRRQLPPLMLVSEQRIDTPTEVPGGANITPVRPRRVSRTALAVQETESFDEADAIASEAPETGTSFAEFAETLGAESLPELLEAATAFSNFVQGRETVTRPQIMHLAQEAMPEGMPVEERLRSFGQLLRQGKIRKLSRGQFAVAESTRFKPH